MVEDQTKLIEEIGEQLPKMHPEQVGFLRGYIAAVRDLFRGRKAEKGKNLDRYGLKG